MQLGWIIALEAAAALIWMVFWGLLTNAVARKNGHTKNWFWLGFLLPGIAAVMAMSKPKNAARRAAAPQNISAPASAPAAPAPAPAPAALAADTAEILRNGGWKCVCGRVNYSYIGTCACGRNREGLNAREAAAEKMRREKEEEDKRRLDLKKRQEEEKKAREAAEKKREEERKKAQEAEARKAAVMQMDEKTKLAEIRKLKKLLDDGIISKEEFEAGKKRYLGF